MLQLNQVHKLNQRRRSYLNWRGKIISIDRGETECPNRQQNTRETAQIDNYLIRQLDQVHKLSTEKRSVSISDRALEKLLKSQRLDA